MEVILLQKVEKLGNLGDRVKVKPGFGRNYLIHQGKATEATAANIARFEARRAELEKTAATSLASAQARQGKLANLAVTIPAKVGAENRLYGSVGAAEIADAVSATGAPIKKQEVRLPGGALRQVGEYDVVIHLHSDVEALIRVNVVAE
ncbi:MAG: 50S ribosomal protein L9 [Gammaproteobacteria bacterium]